MSPSKVRDVRRSRGASRTDGPSGGHPAHGFWAMAACCVPMIVFFVLIALKVIE